MVHDVLGHGAEVAAVLFTGGVYERVSVRLHSSRRLIQILLHTHAAARRCRTQTEKKNKKNPARG